jgi:hypothetical protein
MTEVRWHRNARGHLFELPDPIARRIARVASLLERFPMLGVQVHDPDLPGARRLLIGSSGWSIVYRHDPGQDLVTILMLLPPRLRMID